MWFLNFIPDALLQLAILFVLFSGVGLYILGIFLNFIPTLYPYKESIRILATILIIAGVYGEGSYSNEMMWREKVAEAKAKVAEAEAKSAEANVVIQTKIVKQKEIVHDVQVQLQKEIQVVEKQIDAECKLDPVVPTLHNKAAKNPFNPVYLDPIDAKDKK